jgi:hypothetical protein
MTNLQQNINLAQTARQYIVAPSSSPLEGLFSFMMHARGPSDELFQGKRI